MKIAFVIESLSQGGSERQMLRLAESLYKNGFDVCIIAYHDNEFYQIDNQLEKCVRVIETPSRVRRVLSITKELKNYRPDVVISYIQYSSMYALVSTLGMPRCKHIISWRSYSPQFLNKKFIRILDLFNKRVSAIVCNSRHGYRLWKERRPKDINKLHVIFNLFADLKTDDEYKYSNDKPKRIIVPARFAKVKNPDKLVQAYSRLSSEERASLRIDWFGSDGNDKEYCDKVRNDIIQNDLSEYIHVYPASKQIYSEIARADIVGLFSESEGFPNAICEGMILGKTVLMTKVSDYADLVSDNGYCCESTVDGIEVGLKWAASLTYNELNAMGNRSKLKAEEMFNYSKELQKWTLLFQQSQE